MGAFRHVTGDEQTPSGFSWTWDLGGLTVRWVWSKQLEVASFAVSRRGVFRYWRQSFTRRWLRGDR